eukprot:969382-Amphidinium_carterae.2
MEGMTDEQKLKAFCLAFSTLLAKSLMYSPAAATSRPNQSAESSLDGPCIRANGLHELLFPAFQPHEQQSPTPVRVQ